MTREEAKDLFRMDRDAYGKPKAVMTKLDKIYDSIEEDWEFKGTTDDRGYLIEFPQFGRFTPNTKVVLYSIELSKPKEN